MINEYTGKVQKVIYKTDEFMIAVFELESGSTFTITGNMYGIDNDADLTVIGEWVKHPKYGEQFQVNEWKRPIPKTKDQVVAFLKSGLIKGVRGKRAVDIVNALGQDAIQIIKNDGEKALDGIKGIGKKTASKIVKSIKDTFEVQEIISQLSHYGITANMTLKLYKEYGSDTVKMIQQNPYRLTDIDGVGFIIADEIARKMGIMPTSGYRINAGVRFVLRRICQEKGHSFVFEDELIKETLTALNHNTNDVDEHVVEDNIIEAISLLEEKDLVVEQEKVYPKFLFQYEEGLALKLSKMKVERDGEAMSFIDKQIKKYQAEHGIILAEKQREAVKTLLTEQTLVLTGGAGTGKTTVVKAMIDVYKAINPKAVINMVAPTGRASKRLEEATDHDAMTIHRLIGYRQGELPEYNDQNKLPSDLVVVDEVSMADLQITYYLINALEKDAKVLFIGDADQLPSVGSGNVLNDLIKSGIPTIRLTEIFRQAEQSQIVLNGHRINNGQPLLIDQSKDDFYFIRQKDPKRISDLIVKSAVRFIELGYSLEDILILSPMRKGDCGINVLNDRLREVLNPKNPYKEELKFKQRFFREGDKIMQNRNNMDKDIYNGEIGIVKSITKELNEDEEKIDVMYCEFDNKIVKYHRDDCNQLDVAYAITIHKSQGGEAPIVITPITTSHYVMLARNLYYTGITRATEKVVLIGTDQAMNIAIQNDQVAKRNSRLDERIRNYREHYEALLESN
jgi:exodeoxyribonuclease V alpha subunit